MNIVNVIVLIEESGSNGKRVLKTINYNLFIRLKIFTRIM